MIAVLLALLALLSPPAREVRCEHGWWLQVALRSGEWECDLVRGDDDAPPLERRRGRVACTAGTELVRVPMVHETDPQEARCQIW